MENFNWPSFFAGAWWGVFLSCLYVIWNHQMGVLVYRRKKK